MVAVGGNNVPDNYWILTGAGKTPVDPNLKPQSSDEVVVEEVEVGARADLHERYGIEAVPTIVVADAEGVVRGSFLGPPSTAELWARVAEARSDPPPGAGAGSSP